MVKSGDLKEFGGKRVLVTGHTGFKGSWLSYWLCSLGAEVKGYSLAPYSIPNLFDASNLGSQIDSVIDDINDFSQLCRTVIDFQPDFIFHLAAQSLVRQSYKNPLNTYQTNIQGTANILEALRYLEKACVCICITTDKVYQNNEWHYPYREIDRLGGYDPYSASKACAELVIASYTKSFFNLNQFESHAKAIASARSGNVIGGGDWSEDRLVPDIIKALIDKKEVMIRNPSAIRPWQHVLDPLLGYLVLALNLSKDPVKYSGAWNFGPAGENDLSVLDLAKIALRKWGSGELKIVNDPQSPHEAHLLKLDIHKVITELGWKPQMEAKQAIERTIRWYKQFYEGESAAELMGDDLEFYQSLSQATYDK